MATSPSAAQNLLGYLAIAELEQDHFSAGYLIVDRVGRPVEFHFALPFRNDPAQRILFGKSYESFVFCEQIGTPLLKKPTLSPSVVFVEKEELLEIDDLPMNLVLLAESNEISDDDADLTRWNFTCTPSSNLSETHEILESLQSEKYLSEPFERIREAIHQAHRTAA